MGPATAKATTTARGPINPIHSSRPLSPPCADARILTAHLRRSVGIGRRWRLKIAWAHARGGSSPSSGTIVFLRLALRLGSDRFKPWSPAGNPKDVSCIPQGNDPDV